MPIREGQPAPAFALKDQDGSSVALEDFRGRNVVVYFYPKDDTPGCTKEACGFRDSWSELTALGVAVLGISPDGEASHLKFAKKYDLPFTLLSDPTKDVMRRYGAYGPKVMYGKKTEGVIRSTVWIDGEGRVKRHWKRVSDAATHPARVIEAIQSSP
jgi:thioredoxin-dependent peroxiredoxin